MSGEHLLLFFKDIGYFFLKSKIVLSKVVVFESRFHFIHIFFSLLFIDFINFSINLLLNLLLDLLIIFFNAHVIFTCLFFLYAFVLIYTGQICRFFIGRTRSFIFNFLSLFSISMISTRTIGKDYLLLFLGIHSRIIRQWWCSHLIFI
jgi:hypothetical protein